MDLASSGTIKTFVIQEYLPDDIEVPQPLAIIDVPQADGSGEPTRVYGLLTETELDEISVGCTVDVRFRELFDEGARPINSFKFSVPREDKR
ncbi:hypothetical protein [Natrinema sp. H-ect4]|uniref:hypothetical protein n=1 Tax=Natrinema sp. H-ect4 TaxID=3242699 RepID=UPI0035A9131D